MNIDAMAEMYWASSDPQFVDWDAVNHEANLEDLQRQINNFVVDEEDIEDSVLAADMLLADCKEEDYEQVLDYEPIEQAFKAFGINIGE